MGLYDIKKNLTEIVNSATERIQASLSATVSDIQPRNAGNEQQSLNSDGSHMSTQINKLMNQIDSLQAEVSRLSKVVTDQQKKIENATRTIAALEKNNSDNGTTTVSNDSNVPAYSEVEIQRYIKYNDQIIDRIWKQLENLTEWNDNLSARIKRLENNTFIN